jgi:drug/metabolite transporter (DMT)-like permease
LTEISSNDTPAVPGAAEPPADSIWISAMPGVFVLLWATGFIGARFGLPYAEPFTFLLVRFVIVAALLAVVSAVMHAPWPRSWALAGHLAVAGLLVHGGYLGGVFSSIARGMPVAVSALIVGLQPLLTAVAAGPFLGERITPVQWLGFVLGLAGVVMVLARDFTLSGAGLPGFAFSTIALLSITGGTLYQKRFCGAMDLRSGSVVQFLAAAAVVGVLAATTETMAIRWTGEFLFALGWLIVVLSLGAITLLYLLIRRGVASKIASLFYLVPPVTAILGYVMFGETLGWPAIAGLGVAGLGVALVTRSNA